MGLEFGTARDDAVWHPEPKGRGTYGLLSSCILTMVLCVWTAVHLNLPEHGKPNEHLRRKFWWLMIGLFAPEAVLWTAFQQWREACALQQRMRQLLGQAPPRSRFRRLLSWFQRIPSWFRSRKKPASTDVDAEKGVVPEGWTMTHSYFAIMGGFAFDTEVAGCEILPQGRTRITLTGAGVLTLAEFAQQRLPIISVADIEDKNKASRLAKTIAVVQAAWFTAQCITRLAVGLSISLLELNTFGHAICTLVTYILWWHKPLDVQEPVVIRDEESMSLCAWMCMGTRLGSEFLATSDLDNPTWYAHLVWKSDSPNQGAEDQQDQQDQQLEERQDQPETQSASTPTRNDTASSIGVATAQTPIHRLYFGETIYGFELPEKSFRVETPFVGIPFQIQRAWAAPKAATGKSRFSSKFLFQQSWPVERYRPFIELSPADICRLQLAEECHKNYPNIPLRGLARVAIRSNEWPMPQDPMRDSENSTGNENNGNNEDNIDNEDDNNNNNSDNESNRRTSSSNSFDSVFDTIFDPYEQAHKLLAGYGMFIFALVGLAYGGLHLLAWNPPVKTHAETLLWRISGITVITGGFFPQLFRNLTSLVPFAKRHFPANSHQLGKIVRRWEARYDRLPEWLAIPLSVVVISILLVVLIVVALVGLPVTLAIIPAYIGGILLYSFSRVYLVVECFISISHLQDGVFETPNWAKYFPHFG